MGYPCLECALAFAEFSEAVMHNNETGHEIGAYEGSGLGA